MSKHPKFMVWVGITYEGGSGGGWTSDATLEGVERRIADLLSGAGRIRKEIEEVTLQVEIEKRSFKVWAQGTDGLDAVKERALRLMAGLEEAHSLMHAGQRPRERRRVLEL